MVSEPATQSVALKCPVCAAGFRGVEICPRCGTNLQPLMRIAARAWALRQKARSELRNGDLLAALQCAATAGGTPCHETAEFYVYINSRVAHFRSPAEAFERPQDCER
jgi:hypothetical protein